MNKLFYALPWLIMQTLACNAQREATTPTDSTEFRQLNDTLTRIMTDSVMSYKVQKEFTVNAVRHNKPNGIIRIHLTHNGLTIANTSDESPLDPAHIFSRFYRNPHNQKGNGLGLAIVKSICDYHQWTITYHHTQSMHQFTVRMR